MNAKMVKHGARDAISSLPDEILAKIISLLPTKRAASTSLLSKRWRNLFPLMIHLFGSQHHFYLDDSDLRCPERYHLIIRETFTSFVDKTLSSCNSMKKLSLKCKNGHHSWNVILQWIEKALERGLVDLDFDPDLDLGGDYVRCSFLTNKSLVKLTLGIHGNGCILLGRKRKVSLPMLKSLFLHGPSYSIELSCRLMLPGCPILVELSLHYSFSDDVEHGKLSIEHETLKRVTLHYNDGDFDVCEVNFNTPSLVYLDYSGLAPLHHGTASCVLDSLVEAKLDVDISDMPSYPTVKLSLIISWMQNVKTLSLSSTSVKAIYSHLKELPFFLNLAKLCFESNTEQGWEVLQRLLNKCPKLETLVLKGLHCVNKKGVCIDQDEVKVLEIYAFKGRDKEFRQLKTFLCQMQCLQVMKVEIKAKADHKKLQVISRLLNLPERSSNCEIHLL